MKKILVTGANGFVGYYLVQLLLQKNFSVIATGRGPSRLPRHSNLIYTSLDFTQDEDVKRCFEEHAPDFIVHSGAMSKPDECELNREGAFLTNVSGTINLLNHAAGRKCYFVFLSTDFVFSGTEGRYREEDERNPVNYYGETKMMAEDEVMKYSADWAIVRTVLVYGKPFGSRQNLLTNTALALRRSEKLKIFNDQQRTPTYVEDLARGIASIIEKKATGIFHISGADEKTPYQMAVAVAEYLELDPSLIEKVTEKDFSQPASRPLNTVFNITKAREQLGYHPTTFQLGLEKTFD